MTDGILTKYTLVVSKERHVSLQMHCMVSKVQLAVFLEGVN